MIFKNMSTLGDAISAAEIPVAAIRPQKKDPLMTPADSISAGRLP